VREPISARGGGPRPTGVVDTLSAGYGVINRRPWIVLIPVLLDLFLWFGPQVSVSPLVGQALSRPGIQQSLGAGSDQAFEQTRQTILAAADEFNVLALLAPGWVSVPSIMPALGDGRGPLTFVDSWGTALLLGAGAVLGGVFLGCIYRSIIAQQVRDGVVSPARVPAQALRAWVRLFGLLLVLCLAGLALSIPIVALMTGALLIAREQGTSFVAALAVTAALWAQLYLFFAPDAVFVSEVGPLRAIRHSFAVVRANFWAAIRIGVLIIVILLGMGQIWLALASRAPWGPALGIVGNAYIASGLVAASMLFYRERLEALGERRSVAAAREI
jgi:hypothetical protein